MIVDILSTKSTEEQEKAISIKGEGWRFHIAPVSATAWPKYRTAFYRSSELEKLKADNYIGRTNDVNVSDSFVFLSIVLHRKKHEEVRHPGRK